MNESETPKRNIPPKPGHHIDDADLLAWKHQYMSMNSKDSDSPTGSTEDLSKLTVHDTYHHEPTGQDYAEMDDDELHFEDGSNYDYEAVIQDRLKKANEQLKDDDTPANFKQPQRVSFDAIVKAVDIVQDPNENDNNPQSPAPLPAVVEETSNAATSAQSENPHEYTVPLNDTQPKEGPTLVQQIKAWQFHGIQPTTDRRSFTNTQKTDDSSADTPSSNFDSEKPKVDKQENPADPKMLSSPDSKSMVIAINGEFKLQSESDYTAEKQEQISSNGNEKSDRQFLLGTTKVRYVPTPTLDSNDEISGTPTREGPFVFSRPQSSDSRRRTEHSNDASKTSMYSDGKKSSGSNNQRPNSAEALKSLTLYREKPPSGIDFKKLCEEAAEKKRIELREQQLQKEKERKKREEELAKAKEAYEKWLHDKDCERKRLNEEKRMEEEAKEAQEAQCKKELDELREKKYKDWLERKSQEKKLQDEFQKMIAEDEDTTGGSSSSISNNRKENKRAFRRWLRRKNEQAREEKQRLRLETRELRRRQRRSIKRFQLYQDLQLAHSFGY